MSLELLQDSRLFGLLLHVDRELADGVRAGGCLQCGGRLDTSDYPRKPRGGPPAELKDQYSHRFSFCCDVEGCRRRATPPSVRFLGRRVYIAAAVVLVSAMIHGVTEKRVAELRERVYPSLAKDTLLRWRAWWRDTFPSTPFWRQARARFRRPLDEQDLPASLLDRFDRDQRHRLIAALRFLSPLTTRQRSARAG